MLGPLAWSHSTKFTLLGQAPVARARLSPSPDFWSALGAEAPLPSGSPPHNHCLTLLPSLGFCPKGGSWGGIKTPCDLCFPASPPPAFFPDSPAQNMLTFLSCFFHCFLSSFYLEALRPVWGLCNASRWLHNSPGPVQDGNAGLFSKKY